MLGLGLLDEVDFIVKESGLRCCDGDNGRLTLVCSRWDNRMTVEKKDFYSCSSIYDFGDVALDSFDYIHRLKHCKNTNRDLTSDSNPDRGILCAATCRQEDRHLIFPDDGRDLIQHHKLDPSIIA